MGAGEESVFDRVGDSLEHPAAVTSDDKNVVLLKHAKKLDFKIEPGRSQV
jgi:hypothetical protein